MTAMSALAGSADQPIVVAGTDKAAFTAAFDQAIKEGKSVYIPDGVYDLKGWEYNAHGDLSVVGQSKENTILKGMSNINTYGDVSVQNLSFLDMSGFVPINMNHSGFVDVTLDNITAVNSNTEFTSKSRDYVFLHFSSDYGQSGIENLTIKDSIFKGWAIGIIKLKCQINNGDIVNNEFSEIGYDAGDDVVAVQCGKQTGDNVTTAPAKHILFQNNLVKNIYSAYGTSHNATEGHGLLIYGEDITVKDNKFENLYGGGRQHANLNGGWDHEMIYLKASHSVVDNNTVINGAGANSNGAITLKGNNITDVTVTNNKIYFNYTHGPGIYIKNSITDINESGNTVFFGDMKTDGPYNIQDQTAPLVVFNGQNLLFDTSPTIENGRILAPLRAIFEALGADVQWDGSTQTVMATKDSTEIQLIIGGQAYKNDQQVDLDVPAKIINDRIMVPLRFVSDSFGCQVSWDEATKTVTIISTTGTL